MRVDRYLWFVRIVKSRSLAQGMATAGRLRLNGRAVDKASAAVRVGDILTFVAHGGHVRVLRVLAIPARRGPAPEAQACYEDLVTAASSAPLSPDNVSQQAPID